MLKLLALQIDQIGTGHVGRTAAFRPDDVDKLVAANEWLTEHCQPITLLEVARVARWYLSAFLQKPPKGCYQCYYKEWEEKAAPVDHAVIITGDRFGLSNRAHTPWARQWVF